MENEVRSAEDSAKKAMADAQRLAEDLRRQQDAVSSSEKQRRSIETQACNSLPHVQPRSTFSVNPLTPTVATWVQL